MTSSSQIDLRAGLNPEQAAAAFAPDGTVLVIAAAGTGKTRTLVHRVAHLVERGVDPQRILLLTFTNRAAHEMLDRARALVGAAIGGVWGGTFHHLSNRILRSYAGRIGYRPDFVILDEEDATGLGRAVIRELGLKDKHFPKPEVIFSVASLARNRNREVAPELRLHFENTEVDTGAVLRVVAEYEARKRAMNAMDFDDLLTSALRLLREHDDVRARYQEQFLHVLVDEYQDTNPIQGELVDLLAARHRNLLVVGDDFQSIYSWRGADFRQFLTFPERYPGTQVFKLETNYRSVPGVLSVANACIAHAENQFAKTLRAVRQEVYRPVIADLFDGRRQANYVVENLALLRREGYRLSDIAVLYRSHFHAMEIQLALAEAGINYRITSGVRFFEQAHVKDVCALLRLVHNPSDELAFLRLVQLLPRMGERTAARVWKAVDGRFQPGLAPHRANLRERLPAAAREDWDRIAAALGRIGTGEAEFKQAPGELVFQFVEGFYKEYAAVAFDNAERRLEDIEELVRFMARFAGLADFLNEVALLTNLDAQARAQDPAGDHDAVLLSTVHQAKGLEWKAVFILWLAEGLFPSGRSLETPDGEAEERRLFYVAATRAKDHLFLCVPQMRCTRDGGAQYYTASRFVRELPPALVRRERRWYD